MDVLSEMKQYYFKRDDFVLIVKMVFPDIHDLIDECMNQHLENFSIFRVEEEYYILNRNSGILINWYKNLGRTNTCNKDHFTDKDLTRFMMALREDCVDYINSRRGKPALRNVTMAFWSPLDGYHK